MDIAAATQDSSSPEVVQFPFGAHYSDGSIITRADEIPWTPWGMPGTWFKLLDVNDDFGWMVFLLKVDAGTPATMHKHFSAANAFTLEGWWGYEGRVVKAGQFIKEAGGISHAPMVGPEGTVMLAFGFGPVGGLDDDGNLVGAIDIDWMYNAAMANGAADHIVRKV
jgi:2,4'-dihydroxyacetophenone dioxygenase